MNGGGAGEVTFCYIESIKYDRIQLTLSVTKDCGMQLAMGSKDNLREMDPEKVC